MVQRSLKASVHFEIIFQNCNFTSFDRQKYVELASDLVTPITYIKDSRPYFPITMHGTSTVDTRPGSAVATTGARPTKVHAAAYLIILHLCIFWKIPVPFRLIDCIMPIKPSGTLNKGSWS